MKRAIVIFILAAAFGTPLGFIGSAHAFQSSVPTYGSCNNMNGGDPLQQSWTFPQRLFAAPAPVIRSCGEINTLSKTRKIWPEELAYAYLIRASAYDRIGQKDKAIVDYSRAAEILSASRYRFLHAGILRRMAELQGKQTTSIEPVKPNAQPTPTSPPKIIEHHEPPAPTSGGAFISVKTIGRDGQSVTIVSIDGELKIGDEKRFADAAIGLSGAVVVLSSPGGSLLAGIEIGKAIRLKGFRTLVPEGYQCASACALAWLGGSPRYMGQGSTIGFHAAYLTENGQNTASSSANAVVGAYLNQLGLQMSAIIYITEPKPDEIRWLTFRDAEQIGIEVRRFASGAR